MHVSVIGAGGMVGQKLLQEIAKTGMLGGKQISKLSLFDVSEPVAPSHLGGMCYTSASDIVVPGEAEKIAASRPDLVFHLAALASTGAEEDFDKGYHVNLDGTRALFEAIRNEGLEEPYFPRVIYTSSLAVFGAPLPEIIPDSYHIAPLTSYGTQKAICELLLADYTRRGIFDGIGLRLPTICIRPGKPNTAASGVFSNIVREPLKGEEAVLPVSENVRHWFASPRSAVGYLLHAAKLDFSLLGPRRNLSLPGLSATIAEEIEALRRVAGDKAVALIRREPNALVEQIIAGWPTNFEADQARKLGFVAETSFDEIIQAYIEDELGGAVS